MRRYVVVVGTVLLLACALSAIGEEAVTNKMGELLGVLKSDAGQEQKAAACRDLGLYGNKDAVPALAGLLGDEKLSHMARYGLEQIPDPAVDEALRAALDKVKGQLLVGVINSIGARRDENAIESLSGLLKGSDQQAARAAAAALGRIGTVDAGKVLEDAADGAKGEELQAVCEGLLCCADALVSRRKENKALSLYEKASKADVPARIRAAATRGIILCSGDVNILVEQLNSTDPLMFGMGLRVAQELKGKKVTSAIIFQTGRLPAEKVAQLVQLLGKRGDKAAVPELTGLAKKGDKAVRIAAIRALAEIGASKSASVLMDLLKDSDTDIVQAAAVSLGSLPDPDVNDDVLKMFDCPDNSVRVRMFDLAGQRRVRKALPLLAKAMDDKDDNVRFAAIRNFGTMAGTSEIPSLLEKMIKSRNAGEISAYERALSSICSTASDQKSCVRQLADVLPKATRESRPGLLRILQVAGGPEALETVRGAVKDPDKEMRTAAVRVLSEWKTADVAPLLLELAKTSTEQVDKVLSLRGYLGLASKKELGAKERLAICKEAAPLIQRAEEKRMLMGALGNIGNAESIDLIVSYLDDPTLKREAVSAILSIAKKRAKKQNVAGAKTALEKVVKVAENPADRKTAEELLKQVEKEK